MGVKKFQNLFKNNEASAKKTEASSNEANMEARKESANTKNKNVADKASVEQMTKLIQNKLKDPAMAKKAAQIIEELLNNTSKK